VSTHPSITRAEAYKLRRLGLIKTALPIRLPDTVLKEDLAALVDQLNEDQLHPAQRLVLLSQISNLRSMLGIRTPAMIAKRETR